MSRNSSRLEGYVVQPLNGGGHCISVVKRHVRENEWTAIIRLANRSEKPRRNKGRSLRGLQKKERDRERVGRPLSEFYKGRKERGGSR